MNTREIGREQISALADGELGKHQLDVVLASLRQHHGRSDWDVYHQIGDLLRSDDMAVDLSPGFSARMAARLELEPTIVAPGNQITPPKPIVKSRRWATKGIIAAAAVASAAFIGAPQLMVALRGSSGIEPTVVGASATNTPKEVIVTAAVPDGVVLRDPRVDDYLLAHQRISPSLYSTAQYARSATFAIDTTK